MEEDYCSYEVAKLLKEKGFNERSYCYYFLNGEMRQAIADAPWNNGVMEPIMICAPTHQMAMKWLRDKWLLHVEVYVRPFEKGRERTDKWFYDFCIKNPRTFTVEGQGETYLTYEEAVETALKYALEKLI